MARSVTFALVTGITLAVLSTALLARAESPGDQAALARELQSAWLPLESAIALSQREGTPISAKYEIDDDGTFQLSVYTVNAAGFSEVIFDYSAGLISKVETITDAGDLAAANAQKDTLSKATRTLGQATEEVVRQNSGYRAVNALPGLDGAHPVVEVILFDGSHWKTATGRLD
jgi:hypothetical protein